MPQVKHAKNSFLGVATAMPTTSSLNRTASRHVSEVGLQRQPRSLEGQPLKGPPQELDVTQRPTKIGLASENSALHPGWSVPAGPPSSAGTLTWRARRARCLSTGAAVATRTTTSLRSTAGPSAQGMEKSPKSRETQASTLASRLKPSASPPEPWSLQSFWPSW